MKIAIVTGATSYIGIALIKELLDNDCRVIAIIRPNSSREKLLRRLYDGISFIECELGDIRSAERDVRTILQGDKADELYHIGWNSDFENDRYNLTGQLTNVKYTKEAMRLSERLGCISFVGVGSQAECGLVDKPINSKTPDNPLNAYAEAKCRTYTECLQLSKELGIRFYWPRLLSAYGPYARESILVMLCINACKRREVIDLTAGEQVWDFVHVSDVARSLRLITEKGEPGKKYSIASGIGRPLRDYIRDISEVFEFPELMTGLGRRPYSENEVMYLVGDVSELKEDTGMMFDTDFKSGIRCLKEGEWYI